MKQSMRDQTVPPCVLIFLCACIMCSYHELVCFCVCVSCARMFVCVCICAHICIFCACVTAESISPSAALTPCNCVLLHSCLGCVCSCVRAQGCFLDCYLERGHTKLRSRCVWMHVCSLLVFVCVFLCVFFFGL